MQTLEYAPPTRARARGYLERALLFALAATSIWSLLVEFYAITSMRAFVLWVFLPATVAMIVWALWDRFAGRGYVWRVVWVGALAGFVAACAYDVFRVPFVFAREMHIDAVVPRLPLFKVFPEFGWSIRYGLDHSQHQMKMFTPLTHALGWAYHFSNGMTFGIMYLALIGDAARRSWWWAVLIAVGLELGMLLTPYPKVFGIKVTPTFFGVTLTAHLVFGVALGLCAQWMWSRSVERSRSSASV
jgi:hypothetical protein